MPNLQLKSERNIQTQMLAVLITQLGLNDINPGSVIDIITQAAAQQDFALYYQLAQVARLADIEALTGDDLDLKAFEFGIQRKQAAKASGPISILREEGFVKVTTTFYAGLPAPIAGDTEIHVNDASNALIGTSGTLIIGRGTNNEEQVTYSAAPVNNVNFYTYTLDAPLANDHAVEETVILRQGNDEFILAGTIVIVPATGTESEIQFRIENDVTLLAGEDRVDNVSVIALEAGSRGNITVGAITGEEAFPSPPFDGARASNTSKFTTGKDRETDDELRDRIKSAGDLLTKGVKNAILTSIVGLVDPVSAKRVVSASVILPVDECGPVKIYIDDGTGFEPSFRSQGFEIVRQNSTGGEVRLQIDQFPVQKAAVETNSPETYDMSAGPLTLEYQVGTLSEVITFNPSDFRFADIATAEEIAAAINDKATLIEARTSQGGIYVSITGRSDTNEAIQVVGGTANALLNFPLDKKETINFYIDDVKLSKDGETAILDSINSAPYNMLAVGAFPHTLTMQIDGKTANTQTATLNLADVADPAAVTATEMAAVINRDIAGVVASTISSNTKVRIQSNTLLSSSSKLLITGGTMNDATNGLNFSTTLKEGVDGDYIFNRELGIISLYNPMSANQTATVGSLYTRGKIRAANPELYAPLAGQTLVISVDGGSDQTVTFDGTFVAGLSAQATANFINNQLVGAVAIVREIGTNTFLEINTNTYEPSGTIEVKSTSTANSAFQFPLDTPFSSGQPNQAFQVSQIAGPYDFAEADSLVVVIDNNIVDNTFAITMSYAGTVTSGTSTTVFADSGFNSVFVNADQLVDFFVAFTSGGNTDTGDIVTVADQGGGTFRYTFDVAPPNFANIAVGDLIKITGLADSVNNGNFVITAKGAQYVEVTNPDGENATLQSGTGVMSQRRQVTAYNQLTGEMTVGSPFAVTPNIGDGLIVLPSTVSNVVKYMNNTKITSLSLKAVIGGAEANTKVQIASKAAGSDGYVQVTGGNANEKLGFETDTYRGLQAYNYWIGLVDLVHKTIYGDDTDLVTYPGVGAAGITFQVLAPTTKQINVNLDVTLTEGTSIASLENEIKSAVTGYVNTLGVGQDMILEEIRAAVIDIAGIIDVTISEPTANIAAADNEVIRVADPDILIG